MISNSSLVCCDRVFLVALHDGCCCHDDLASLGCVVWFTAEVLWLCQVT